jgi:hypothetical protein
MPMLPRRVSGSEVRFRRDMTGGELTAFLLLATPTGLAAVMEPFSPIRQTGRDQAVKIVRSTSPILSNKDFDRALPWAGMVLLNYWRIFDRMT